jgi:hypothetical protein
VLLVGQGLICAVLQREAAVGSSAVTIGVGKMVAQAPFQKSGGWVACRDVWRVGLAAEWCVVRGVARDG